MKTKASILIANYNNQKYINKCVSSLFNQSYKNIEIIFHDDGSIDNSLLKAKKFKKINIIKNNKRGKYGSFNQMAAFPKGPIALSLQTQLPVIPAAFINIDNEYKLIFGKPFIVPHFENDAQSIQHGLKVLSKELEKLILLDPNQWHSIQPVWTSEY